MRQVKPKSNSMFGLGFSFFLSLLMPFYLLQYDFYLNSVELAFINRKAPIFIGTVSCGFIKIDFDFIIVKHNFFHEIIDDCLRSKPKRIHEYDFNRLSFINAPPCSTTLYHKRGA